MGFTTKGIMTTPVEAMIETVKSSQAELSAIRKDLDAMRERVPQLLGGIEFCLHELEKAMSTGNKWKS